MFISRPLDVLHQILAPYRLVTIAEVDSVLNPPRSVTRAGAVSPGHDGLQLRSIECVPA